MYREELGKGKERPGKEHGLLCSSLSHLVSWWKNSVYCGAHSWGREKLKEADSYVLPFLQMNPQDQGGGVVWCRNVQTDLEVCVLGPTDTVQQE